MKWRKRKNMPNITDYKERIKICKKCPRYEPALARCKECGCFLGIKARIKSSECPHPQGSKWKTWQ